MHIYIYIYIYIYTLICRTPRGPERERTQGLGGFNRITPPGSPLRKKSFAAPWGAPVLP